MTRPLGFYVHHHGSGHLTRASEIARVCADPVVGFSTLPRPEDWPGAWVDLPDDDAPIPTGADPTAGGILHWAPTGDHPYPARMRRLAAGLAEHDVALLHVDVSVEVTLFARLLGIPVTVAAMRGDRTDTPHRLAYDAASLLLAPWPADLPEPGLPPHVLDRTIHVGGISRFDGRIDQDGDTPVTATPDERRAFVLWGHGGGDWSPETWDAVHAATPGWTWRHGAPRDEVWQALRSADVVVAHGGQNAVAEVAAARRPAIVVALDRPHGEQEATCRALARGDLAETIHATDATQTDWSALLERAASRDGARWAGWSDGSGAVRAASALEAVVRGRRPAARTAVITLVHGRHDHLRGMIAGLARGTSLPERLVVVAMDDPEAATVCEQACAGTGLRVDVVHVDADGHLPLALARNTGAARAAALGCTRLVFLDVDCIPSPGLVARYAEVVAVGPQDRPTVWSGAVAYLPPPPPEGYDPERLADLADPHPARPAPAPGETRRADDVRLFWSLSFGVSADDFARLGGFCEDYVGYGGEDTDFALALQAAGGDLVWVGGADAHHQYHPTQTPPVGHLHDIVRNANLFADRWGWHPMEGWLDAFAEAGLARFDAAADRWVVVEEEEEDA